ncbi:T9SS type A sorting domain-containing protein [Hymenobacter sp. BT175]|uniref:T9SS type A sorting domain-containing protein n=1 Tax=Hymenobacter translucens TaxID=2886507 RepID=UPI001D0F0366|nr:T9SS type A sorting domain-containing protein [Hymenobacter translucens]MCC2548003.1 T9SS type A sorting domain-containing protein [Hymenobacter translucens]
MIRLLLTVLAFSTGAFYQKTTAQSIIAGATAGVRHVDISPDRVVAVTRPAGPNTTVQQFDSLDLDSDGRFDLRLVAFSTTWSQAGRTGTSSEALLLPLHTDVEIAAASGGPVIIGFTPSSEIQSSLPPPTGSPSLPNIWANPSNLYRNAALAHIETNPAGGRSYGYWNSGQDIYAGVRLRSTAGAGWAYGWVGLQVSNLTLQSITLTIKGYAFEQLILATPQAAARTWQLYPNPAAEILRLRTERSGQLRLLDAAGRVVQQHILTAGGEQELSIATLPAGIYLLELTTAAGRTTQRLHKL